MSDITSAAQLKEQKALLKDLKYQLTKSVYMEHRENTKSHIEDIEYEIAEYEGRHGE